MPGSHPSSSPNIGPSQGEANSSIHHYQRAERQDPHRRLRFAPNVGDTMSIDNTLAHHHPASPSLTTEAINTGSIHAQQQDSQFAAVFSDFVRSHERSRVEDRPRVESYMGFDALDEHQYQSLLTAVSNIQMAQTRPRSTHATEVLEEDSFDHELTQSPYAMEEDEDERMHYPDPEEDDADSYSSNSAIEDIYDLQHIMVHHQRQFENQIRQARQEYNQYQPQHSRIRDHHEDMERVHEAARGLEILHDSPAVAAAESHLATAMGRFSPDALGSSFLQPPSMSISASYFSPTTESTIVLSSPPPGRQSSLFPFHGSASVHPHNTLQHPEHRRSSVGHNSNSNTNVPYGNGPYRPFMTGRDLNHLEQQQQQQQQQHSRHPSLALTTDSGSSDSSDMDNHLDFEGGRESFGQSDAGRWSTYGSVTHSTRSFERHRYLYYRQQEQQQRLAHAHSRAIPRPNYSLTMAEEREQHYSRSLSDHHRRGPHALTPSPSRSNITSSIPIPSRYLNSLSSIFPQHALSSSASSHLFRPNNILTNHGYHHQNGYRQPSTYSHHDNYAYSPAQDIDDAADVRRRRAGAGQPQPYSETVERAEAGGWAAPPLPTSHRYDNAHDQSSRQSRDIGRKEVVRMACCFCDTIICERGMKAQLLADQAIGLFSTDDAPQSVQLVGDDYKPTNCSCRIRDTACLVCGNAIGYHITQPCTTCLSAANNGHLWLFHPEYIISCERKDPLFARTLRWEDLPEPEQDYDTLSLAKVHQTDRQGRLLIGGMVRREYDATCR